MRFLPRASTRRRAPARRSRKPPPSGQVGGEGYRRLATLQHVETARPDRLPVAARTVGPEHANLGGRPLAEPEMQPAELAAGMAAADRDLAPHDGIAFAASPRSRRRSHRGSEPAARASPRSSGRHSALVLRQTCAGRIAVDDHQVEQPVEVEIGERRAARLPMLAMPALSPASVNLPSACCSSRLLGSFIAKSGISPTLPLATNRSTRPSLFTSSNCACQAVLGFRSSPI